MHSDLLPRILEAAYRLDVRGLDSVAQQLGLPDWAALTNSLDFDAYDSGGGCLMMFAPLPDDHHIEVTDGQADLPTNVERFYVGIVDSDGVQLISVFSPAVPGLT